MNAGSYGIAITVTPNVGTGLVDFTGATAVALVTIDPVTKARKSFSMTVADDFKSATYITQQGDFANPGVYELQCQATYADAFIPADLTPLQVGPAI